MPVDAPLFGVDSLVEHVFLPYLGVGTVLAVFSFAGEVPIYHVLWNARVWDDSVPQAERDAQESTGVEMLETELAAAP